MAHVSTFEIHAENPDVSSAFYIAAFGWTITRIPFGDTAFWQIDTGQGPDGRLIKRFGAAPATGAPVMGAIITVTVDDIDACSARILNSGGIAALPKFDMPGVGSQAYFLDPDRNVFGIFQPSKA